MRGILLLVFISLSLYADDIFPARWEAIRENSRSWTIATYTNLPLLGLTLLNNLPEDYKEFCPELEDAGIIKRQNFYVYLLSAMGELESYFDPDLEYQEKFKDSQGEYVISRGILQISIESTRRYQCNLQDAQELHDPEKNLLCGVRILDKLLEEDGRISGYFSGRYHGGSRYWAVLRSSLKLNQIKTWTRQYCQSQF